MSKKEYLSHLVERGYTILNEGQVGLGTLVFDVKETVEGAQSKFCLKISAASDLNLCPNPWR